MIKKSTVKSKILSLIIPFITVFAIVCIALIVYVKVDGANYGEGVTIIIMLATILVLSIIFTVCDLIRRRLTLFAPVKAILDATEKITSGDFNVQLTPSHTYHKYNDLDLIMENINVMVGELKKSALLNTDFVSNVSHEIKTPLSVIQSYVSLLEKSKDEEQRQECIKTIKCATIKLSNLVTNILKLNKLENQEIHPSLTSFKLHESLSECILSYEALIEKKQLNVECDLEDITLTSDKGYLDIVWANLISNAIKFTNEGGSIRITLKQHPRGATVEVTDTGCGISNDTGAKIFDKFYQGDTSHSSLGNGLGLALVRKIIDVLGGEIKVKSELGVGTTFTVTVIGA